MKLERQKFQSELILKAIETGNSEAATKNLLFLLRLGFIEDPTGRIGQLQNNPQDAPVLPPLGRAATEMVARLGLTVQAIQQALKEAGYYTGEINGLYDRKTFEAVATFQRARGMPADGLIGPQTAMELKKLIQQNPGNQ